MHIYNKSPFRNISGFWISFQMKYTLHNNVMTLTITWEKNKTKEEKQADFVSQSQSQSKNDDSQAI